MIKFKIDVLQALKDKGYNTNVLRKNKLIGENALQQIRGGGVPGIKTINAICNLLKCQPGKILEWIPDPSTDQEQTNE